MRCILAFLLIPQEGLESTKRLAVMSDEFIGSYYDVFKLGANENFPVVESSTGIKMTEVEITGPGTYPRAYCSINLPKKTLIKEVTRNLKSAYYNSHLGLGDADKAADRCLEVLRTLSVSAREPSDMGRSTTRYRPLNTIDSSYKSTPNARKPRNIWQRLSGTSSHQLEEPPKILLSKIREMEGCSDLGLISLAYQKKIKVTGFGVYFAPEYSNAEFEVEFEVEFDDTVDINDIVFQGQLFAQNIYLTKYYVLAWYMGHLHIFKKNTPKSSWWPETLIGSENGNGEKIIDFICKNYKVLQPLTKVIHEHDNLEYFSECCFSNCFTENKEYRQESNRLIAEIRPLKLERLPESVQES
ncbi:putative effector protein [Blumeria hordei DH14]|uniref:Putative effector protein n=1 Tax=Blumeria graminis f. sp. hordei (strain DH14) TaxID=546991 RepID=N1J6Y0_BLUG1|nr:putative effector protein [Blumeria hordei DH14]